MIYLRAIISGGGTGGHIYPAISIAKELITTENAEILFVGTADGMERELVAQAGLNFSSLDVRGLDRKISLSNIVTVIKAITAIWQARRLLRSFRPDIVIGTGGYVCGPILMAASLMGIPTLIQEQNVFPGLTNRILARFADKIALGYAEAEEYFSDPHKAVCTGNPVRAAVIEATREEGLEFTGLKADRLTLLVVGGSRGARSINTAMLSVHKYFSGNKGIQILHITGEKEYNSVVNQLQADEVNIETDNIHIKPYLHNMPAALAVADLAVFRAGAIGLAELTVRGIPSILIPYPHAAENHQEYNARALQEHGAALMIKDAQLSGEVLIDNINRLIDDKDALARMAQAALSLGHPRATSEIARLAVGLIDT